jgi:CBS domain-containing protein
MMKFLRQINAGAAIVDAARSQRCGSRGLAQTVADIMLPMERLHLVKPATTLTDALETMGSEDINQLPVMSNGHLDGIISQSHILRLLQARAESTCDL